MKNFSNFNLLPFDFMYFWWDGQLAAEKYKYIPENLNRLTFLEKTEFSSRIQKVDNAGKVTIKFSDALKD